MKRCQILSSMLLLMSAASYSTGEVVITATESHGDVILRGTGTLDLSALSLFNDVSIAFSGVQGTPPSARVGAQQSPIDTYIGSSIVAPTGIGSLESFIQADSASGDSFGVSFFLDSPRLPPSIEPGSPSIDVPRSYTSGAILSGEAIFEDHSFATLGLTPGTYSWIWGEGSNLDSLTLQVVPEPASVLYFGMMFVFALSLGRLVRLSCVRG